MQLNARLIFLPYSKKVVKDTSSTGNQTAENLSRSLDVRYARSFLKDLRNLEYAARERVYEAVFNKFQQIDQIQDLPELKQLDSEGILYRCTIDNYMIGLELTGNIIKFLRVLPTPDI
jgi:mRNA-degrading endonuclease RelE of RelBE toxin-antitoxin system